MCIVLLMLDVCALLFIYQFDACALLFVYRFDVCALLFIYRSVWVHNYLIIDKMCDHGASAQLLLVRHGCVTIICRSDAWAWCGCTIP